MKSLGLVLLLVSRAAVADVQFFTNQHGTLLIELDDPAGDLEQLVGHDHKGTVRCFREQDHVMALAGAGERQVVGCFVALRRDGKLVPPPASTTRWSFQHLMPTIDGPSLLEATKDGVEVTITGAAGNAIALWTEFCGTHGDLRCEENNGMLGKVSIEPVLAVGKGGMIRRPAAR